MATVRMGPPGRGPSGLHAPAAQRGPWLGTYLEGCSRTKGKLRTEAVSWGPRASSRNPALTAGEVESPAVPMAASTLPRFARMRTGLTATGAPRAQCAWSQRGMARAAASAKCSA